jgi:hypothetical protein
VVQLCAGLAGLYSVAHRPPGNTAAYPAVHGPGDAPSTAGRPNPPDYSGGIGADPRAAAARTAAVRDLLARRSSALLSRDRAAFLDTVDARAPAPFRARQAAFFDNLARVPLAQWRFTVDPAHQRPVTAPVLQRYHAPVWRPRATLCYALRGYDDRCTERPQELTFVQRHSRWYLGDDGAGSGADSGTGSGARSWRGLWDFGPVVVRQGEHSLLLGHPANAGRLAELADQVDQAVPEVTAVWGAGWAQRVVVLVPDSQQEMTQLLGGSPALAEIAAVATADYTDPASGAVRGQRVVINPANLGRLGTIGRIVVLRHEITHLATRAVTGPALPTWLVEGFADYVGYLDTGVPVGAAAQDLAAEVRRGRYPQALPADAAFRFDGRRLAQSYEESWLACRLVAEQAGSGGLVRLYREIGTSRADSGTAVERAFRQVLGIGLAEFTDRWRATVVTELS